MGDTDSASGVRASEGDEVWTIGEATVYLNSGGVDFRIKPKKVRQWADDPGGPVALVAGGQGRWRRVLASSVRAERARLLREVGRDDPGWVPPPHG